jgi:hypothetical protein
MKEGGRFRQLKASRFFWSKYCGVLGRFHLDTCTRRVAPAEVSPTTVVFGG